MRRRFGSGKLMGVLLRRDEEVNPMDGLANLSDVMLVLACGLLLALIINWNVDVAGAGSVPLEQGQEMTELEGMPNGQETNLEEAQYEEMGTVYRDPVTGKLYMVVKEDDA